jgi:hypothetical protein
MNAPGKPHVMTGVTDAKTLEASQCLGYLLGEMTELLNISGHP